MSVVFFAITVKQMVYSDCLKQRSIESTKLMPTHHEVFLLAVGPQISHSFSSNDGLNQSTLHVES